jgi:hypothetical protein
MWLWIMVRYSTVVTQMIRSLQTIEESAAAGVLFGRGRYRTPNPLTTELCNRGVDTLNLLRTCCLHCLLHSLFFKAAYHQSLGLAVLDHLDSASPALRAISDKPSCRSPRFINKQENN